VPGGALLATQQSAGTYLRAGLLLVVGLVLYGLSRAAGASDTAAEPSPDEDARVDAVRTRQ
jgi:hypothetical protein